MNRTTIDFGIDLGTTNSAIAVLKGVKPEVVKSNLDTDITPSAVFIGRQGNIIVGSKAKSKLEDDRSAEDAYIEFKRRMGGDSVYAFKSSGLRKSPEELSAEVLKSLKGNVQQRMDEDIKAALCNVRSCRNLSPHRSRMDSSPIPRSVHSGLCLTSEVELSTRPS